MQLRYMRHEGALLQLQQLEKEYPVKGNKVKSILASVLRLHYIEHIQQHLLMFIQFNKVYIGCCAELPGANVAQGRGKRGL